MRTQNGHTARFSQILTNSGDVIPDKLALTIFLKFDMVKDLNLNYPLRIVGLAQQIRFRGVQGVQKLEKNRKKAREKNEKYFSIQNQKMNRYFDVWSKSDQI